VIYNLDLNLDNPSISSLSKQNRRILKARKSP